MADIHILPENGEAIAYPEERIAELLRGGHFSPAALYWREGMADWEPLTTYQAPIRASTRRTEPVPLAALAGQASGNHTQTKSIASRAAPAPRPVQADRLATTGSTSRPPSRPRGPYYRFRRNPWPVTIVLELWLVACLVIALLELAQAVDNYQRSGSVQPALATVSKEPTASFGPDTEDLVEVKASGSGHAAGMAWQPLEWSGWAANLLLLVPYFIWLHRTVINCRYFSPMMRLRPGLAIGDYFIPFVNLFRPCQGMQEIWRVSGNPRGWLNDRSSVLVALWWVLTLTTIGVSIESSALFSTIQSHDDAVFARLFFVIQKCVQIAWYFTFIAVVAGVLHRQRRAIAKSRRRGKPAQDHGANGASHS